MAFLQRASRAWRLAVSRTCTRAYSEQSAKANDPAVSRLFENVTMPPETGSNAASISGHVSADALEHSAVGRIFSTVGNALFFGAVGAGAFFGYYTYRYSADEVEKMVVESKQKERGNSLWAHVMSWYLDKRTQLESEMKKYADPPSDKLLPDLPPQARHIKTLVLDLDGILIHSDWSRGRGWRTFKRPGADDFIKDLAQYYELVVYTSQLPTYADPILDRLDPQRMIQYRLYRDSTQYVDGRHVRDLSKLNRDLKQVLLITSDPEAYALQPDNAIKLGSWKGQNGDTTLLDLLPFLEAVVRTHVPDVRAVVKSYEGQDIPTAYKERMKAVQEKQASKKKSAGLRGW